MVRNAAGFKVRYLFQALVILLIVSCDQFLKFIIRSNMAYGQSIPAEGGFVRVLYTLNDGVAFSMLQGTGTVLIVIQAVMVLVISIALVLLNLKRISPVPLYCLSLMLGGGIGNLIDRIMTGKVTDFIAVGDFPVFNLADSALTVGCFIMIFWLIVSEISSSKGQAGHSEPEAGLTPESGKGPEEKTAEGL